MMIRKIIVKKLIAMTKGTMLKCSGLAGPELLTTPTNPETKAQNKAT